MAVRDGRFGMSVGRCVHVAQVPSANERWRDRLRLAGRGQAERLEIGLRELAAAARHAGWPVADGSRAETPGGCFIGLEIAWLAIAEGGATTYWPSWSLHADGDAYDPVSRSPIDTNELASALVRERICDDLPVHERRRVADDETRLGRRGVDDALTYLGEQIAASPWLTVRQDQFRAHPARDTVSDARSGVHSSPR